MEDAVKLSERYVCNAGALRYFPIVVDRAIGSKIYDAEGNEYLDFLSSAAVANTGHLNKEVVRAIESQLKKCINYTSAYLYTSPPTKLAELLTKVTPGSFAKKVSFGFSGSDGVDNAIKFARGFTRRKKIAAFKGSYHGTTYGAISATDMIDRKKKRIIAPLPGFEFFEYPDCFRCPLKLAYPDCSISCLDAVKKNIDEKTAGVIMEPIQGDAGVIIPPPGFVKGVKEITEKNGAVFIDEEVQSGMGRTGKLWAIEHYGTEPDLLVSAKALGGEMPISAVIGKKEVMDSLPPPMAVFTHGGHSLCASAAIANLEFTLKHKLPERAERLGDLAMKRFKKFSDEHKIIGDVRGKGLMIGIEIVKGKKSQDKKSALKVCYAAWKKGLLLITFGKHGNVLRIAPPLIIEEDELLRGIEIIEESIKDVEKGLISSAAIEKLQGW